MTRIIGRRFLLGTTLAAFAGAAAVAVAQPAAGHGPGMMGGGGSGTMGGAGGGMMGGGGPGTMGSGGPGMMGGFWNTGTYLDALKTQLAITPGEEPAWNEYADTVSGVGNQMEGLHQTMFESMGTASWQERRNLMNKMFQARQQAFDMVHAAATKLVSALAPAQQAKAKAIVPGMAQGPGMMGQR